MPARVSIYPVQSRKAKFNGFKKIFLKRRCLYHTLITRDSFEELVLIFVRLFLIILRFSEGTFPFLSIMQQLLKIISCLSREINIIFLAIDARIWIVGIEVLIDVKVGSASWVRVQPITSVVLQVVSV